MRNPPKHFFKYVSETSRGKVQFGESNIDHKMNTNSTFKKKKKINAFNSCCLIQTKHTIVDVREQF